MNLPVDLPVHVIEDVQNIRDVRCLAIDKVGIKSLRHPIMIAGRDGTVQNTVATFDMYVHLPQDFKGTHMSRFVEILNGCDHAVSVGNLHKILEQVALHLEAQSGHIEMRFPFFVMKQAPVSGVQSLMDYDVTFVGEIRDGTCETTLKVLVPVTSLCPCSKKISNYGAHNQRSHVTITARLKDELPVEDLIDLVEAQASSQLYGLLKRVDEKYVTEYAYDNPKFVEDMVRDVAAALNRETRIGRYTVECENFESIHNHSAYAVIEGRVGS